MKKFLLTALLFVLVSCSDKVDLQAEPTQNWKYADLRLIDPSDSSNPGQDIIAVYLRERRDSIQIRIDLLKQDPQDLPFLLILFDNGTGGSYSLPFGIKTEAQWDSLLLLPPDGKALLVNHQLEALKTARISIIRDPLLDAITVRLNKSSLPGFSLKTKVKLLSIRQLSTPNILDETESFFIGASPPHSGKVMIALWSTFSGETPAQALRSWDGAHTGPLSSRHGLRWLVEAVEATGVPVTLINFDRPENWSALDYLGVSKHIRKLVDQGRIILMPQDLLRNINITDLYDEKLEGSQSIDLRKRLVENALKAESTLIFGGDFSKTGWGNYETAFQVLNFIANHPWIKLVSDRDILEAIQTSPPEPPPSLEAEVRAQLLSVPRNEVKVVAEQMLRDLLSPGQPNEKELRCQYIGQIGHLIAISNWSRDRQAVLDCSKDFDWDGETECFLASDTIAAVIETTGGYISFAFVYQKGRFHQIIGPTYQLATGLSDPISWDLDKGIAADPSVIPGAFSGENWHQHSYTPLLIEPDTITLQESMGQSQKTLTLYDEGIQFSYTSSEGETFYIPLVIDPWTMMLPDWGNRYNLNFSSEGFAWGIPLELIVITQSSDPLELFTFRDSFEQIHLPENPNFAYPPGHYLPFPLALGQITSSGKGIINITIQR